LRVANHHSLKAMGLTRPALEKAADLALRDPYDRQGQTTREDILAMLLAAFEGARPARGADYG
jgi:hypothetical protein